VAIGQLTLARYQKGEYAFLDEVLWARIFRKHRGKKEHGKTVAAGRKVEGKHNFDRQKPRAVLAAPAAQTIAQPRKPRRYSHRVNPLSRKDASQNHRTMPELIRTSQLSESRNVGRLVNVYS